MICDRCRKESKSVRMSRFNTDLCCEACLNKEKKHPLYQEAARIEWEHVLEGDYNFEGVGKPEDL